MELTRESAAGSLEKSDCLVTVKPSKQLALEIESSVMMRYGNQIRKVVNDALEEMQVTSGYIRVQDNGALDYCLRARVITALKRGCVSSDR
ncbi:MAG: citrate lyase acyl carrier protein [Syntrophomonadaceae bacterium]|jgi:citrate lyase subunit gamma (acyl carrier protein)